MSQTQRVSGVATAVHTTPGGAVLCLYHQTIVAKLEGEVVTLDTGGWRTATAKMRMNQFANQYCGRAFAVYQERGEWFVWMQSTGERKPFTGQVISFKVVNS